ncbi:MAG: asparagine synthase-related protein [Candidatus Polarisedimenticolaceae bacterium]|nr:asparagine synthase-related protein [Candidatus Polarisedimenticolaceae bacterium]
MSAIAVILNLDKAPVDHAILEDMAQQVAELGPDGINYLYRNNIGLAYLALNSTPEALHETQPLESEDKRYLLVADARIDNRPELLAILRGQLPNKQILTDPDIILAAYRKWGTEAPAHLIGDFAFVIWDQVEEELFAARDTMHARPIHYAEVGQSLCITTDAQQILKHPRISGKPNLNTLACWLMSEPRDHLCMFEGINSLPAGSSLHHTGRQLHIKKYWNLNPDYRIRYKKTEEYQEHLKGLLSRTVSDRMRTNGSIIASELSGGMDSTTVTALAQQQAQAQSKQLLALSHEYNKHPACSESVYINEIVQRLGLKHEYIDIEHEGGLDYYASSPAARENPSGFWLPRVLPSTAHAANAGARVLLTGIGGDEMCWGHPHIFPYRLMRGDLRVIPEIITLSKRNKLPIRDLFYCLILYPFIPEKLKQVKRAIASLFQSNRPSSSPDWLSSERIKQLTLQLASNKEPIPHFRNRAQREWFKSLARAYYSTLHIYRWAGATSGIDVRHPFVDRRLMEFTFAVPVELWHQQSHPKWLLRRTMSGLLPDSVVWRAQKTDFSSYYLSELKCHKKTIKSLLENNFLNSSGLISSTGFSEALDSYLLSANKGNTLAYCYAFATISWCATHCSKEQMN